MEVEPTQRREDAKTQRGFETRMEKPQGHRDTARVVRGLSTCHCGNICESGPVFESAGLARYPT